MLVALDVGNTNLTLALVEDGTVGEVRRAFTRADSTADEAELLLDGLVRLAGGRFEDAQGLVVASVVPDWTRLVRRVSQRRGVPLLMADALTIPIPIRVDHPDEVGADRLVNAFAAGRLHGTPAIVVDLGTATTFDVVASDGAYIGGAIAPGVQMGLDTLAARTAQLPRIELRRPARAIGTDTASAMLSGAVLGYTGLVRELLERIREELAVEAGDGPVCAVATGGLANAEAMHGLPGVDVVDPELTMKGLALLHQAVAVPTT